MYCIRERRREGQKGKHSHDKSNLNHQGDKYMIIRTQPFTDSSSYFVRLLICLLYTYYYDLKRQIGHIEILN